MTFVQYFTEQISVWQYLDFFVRIVAACFCGAAIGFERSRRLKSAGIRTHIVVCCAAALMMIVSKYGFIDLTSAVGNTLIGTNRADPARIAAQVVSGISFLGAGVIFKHGASIKGLTTAAGIWATAGIGLAIGAGMYVIGLFAMLVIVIIQFVMHKFKFGTDSWSDTNIEFNVSENGEFQKEFLGVIEKWGAQLEEIGVDNAGDNLDNIFHYKVIIKTPASLSTEDIVNYLSSDSRISKFSVIPGA